eukprot:2470802-Pyramimonas_sp.AAC.1
MCVAASTAAARLSAGSGAAPGALARDGLKGDAHAEGAAERQAEHTEPDRGVHGESTSPGGTPP